MGGYGAGDTILSGALVGSANTFLTKSGAGTLTLSTAKFTSGLTVNDGAVLLTGAYDSGSSSANLVINAGSFRQTSTGENKGSGSYAFIQNGGSSSLEGTSTFKGNFSQYGGSVSLSGSINDTSITINGASAAFTQTSAGQITGSAKTFRVTNGTAALSGANSYTGATTVTAGTLLINGDNSAATGAVTVSAAGFLGGIGTIGGITTVSGTLSPGNSPGTLTFASGLNINNGSTVVFEAGDLLVVGGALDLNNNWTLQLGPGFQDGGSTTLFTYSTLAGSPDLDPTFDISGLGFTPGGPLSLSDNGSSIMLNGISVVPEPTVWMLLGVAATFLMSTRRRRSELKS